MHIHLKYLFDDLLQLPPVEILETSTVLKRCVLARSRLAALNEAVKILPDKDLLMDAMSLLEAQANLAVDGITTTIDDLFRQVRLNDKRSATSGNKEVLRVYAALHEGYKNIQQGRFYTAIAQDMASTVAGKSVAIRHTAGVHLIHPSSSDMIYTPPDSPQAIIDQLAGWERNRHNNDHLNPLVRIAISHYQFVAIHPFDDGNERTSRILNILSCLEHRLLDTPILPVSRYFAQHNDDYHQLLHRVSLRQEWEPWLLFMLQAVEETAIWALARVHAIDALIDETSQHVESLMKPRIAELMIKNIFSQPYCRITQIAEAANVTRITATSYLRKLCQKGVLREIKVGRSRLFAHDKYLNLIINDTPD